MNGSYLQVNARKEKKYSKVVFVVFVLVPRSFINSFRQCDFFVCFDFLSLSLSFISVVLVRKFAVRFTN